MTHSNKFPARSPEDLLDKIRHEFHQLTWDNYAFNNDGWDHEVIILDNTYVFRFPNEPDYLDQLADEVGVLKFLKPLVGIRIPEYSFVASDKSFAGYKLISGSQLSPAFFDSLASSVQAEIVTQLAQFLSVIHRLDVHDPHLRSVPKSDIKEDHERLHAQAKNLKTALSEADYELALKIIHDADDVVNQNQTVVFTHGDVYSRHLFWEATDHRLGLIDFSDMNFGDPAFDFAELYEYGQGFVEEVYQQYTGPKDDTFLQRAVAYEKRAGVYMMIDHFINHKTTFAVARETFDMVKESRL